MILTVFLNIFIVLSIVVPAKSEIGGQNARFTGIVYDRKIHVGTQDVWTFTIFNANRSGNDQNAAQFSLIFYVDNELWFDEYNHTQYRTWSCDKGSAVSKNYNIKEWHTLNPTTHDLRIELYWVNNGTARLEDTTLFAVAITVHIPLQHILATGYLAAYLIACFVLFSYDYVQGLEE